jgi:hypothetical protein
MSDYSTSSPYYLTEKFGNFLDLYQHRSIPKNRNDRVFKINQIYQYRPDLLAFDLYKRSSLWWVFAVRNIEILQDPIFDFRAGVSIYIPDVASLKELGL